MPRRSSLSISASTIGAAKPKSSLRKLMMTVLRSARGNVSPPKRRWKLSRPFQGLCSTPVDMEKSLNATISPIMGT